MPTKTELRAMSYLAVIHGAHGIIWYRYAGYPKTQNATLSSSDFGDFSRFCPDIHPYFAIADHEIAAHSVEFREAVISQFVRNNALKVATAMALIALDFYETKISPMPLQEAKEIIERMVELKELLIMYLH